MTRSSRWRQVLPLRPFLLRIFIVLGLVGLFIALGGVPDCPAGAGTGEEPPDAEGRVEESLRQEVEQLRRQLDSLKAEYQRAKAVYQKAMEQMEEQLQALESRLRLAAPPPVVGQAPADGQPSQQGPPRAAGRPVLSDRQVPLRTLSDEELDRITGAAAPSSPGRVAQAQAPPPAPETPAPEPTTPAPAAPTPPTPSTAGEGEEEREVTRVPLATIEKGGVLLRPGHIQFELGFGYTHSRSTRLILTGFSVLPLIILGTLESEKVTTDSFSPTFSVRYGIIKDLQFDFTIPAAYQIQRIVRLSNEVVALTEDTATELGLGDITAGLSYQLFYEHGLLPDLSVSLRARFPTGRSQFDIFETIAKQGAFLSVEDFVRRLNAEGLPLGSGFWALSGSISAVKAFDPIVLFGTIGYTYSFPRDVTLISITGTPSEGGVLLHPQPVTTHISPGGTLSLSVGFAISLTREVSVSFGFSDGVTFSTKQAGRKIADSYLNVGQFNVGVNLALSRRVSVSANGAIGVTPDAPNLGFTLSVPVAFESVTELWPFKGLGPLKWLWPF